MSVADPALNVTFECLYQDGAIRLEPRLDGHSLSATIPVELTRIVLSLRIGSYIPQGAVARGNVISLNLVLRAEALIESSRRNWVGWSKIGEASFVLDTVNDAGYRPMNWRGDVLAIKQLGRGAVIYGSNGITLMSPVSSPAPTFSFRDLAYTGLLSKDAVCGTEFIHYFIDAKYQLWKLTPEGATYLDFSEHLKVLINPVLFYDEYIKHVLISDSEHGFTLAEDRMGDGYSKLSGYVYESGSLLVSSPQLIEYEPLSLTTDILDFGRRSQKTLTNIQVGTDVPEWLEIAYDYRYDLKQPFRSTRWVRLNIEGIAYLACAGIDFRIKVRARRVARLDVDYINISFKTTDQRFSRSAYVGNLAISAFAGSVSHDSTTSTRPGERVLGQD
jgi:hypothetical protein